MREAQALVLFVTIADRGVFCCHAYPFTRSLRCATLKQALSNRSTVEHLGITWKTCAESVVNLLCEENVLGRPRRVDGKPATVICLEAETSHM